MHQYFENVVKSDDTSVELPTAAATKKTVVSYTNVFALQRAPENDETTPAVTEEIIYAAKHFVRAEQQFFMGSCITDA